MVGPGSSLTREATWLELQERDQRQHEFLTSEVERLRTRVTTVDRLERENRLLGAELRALRAMRQGKPFGAPEGDQRAPLAAVSPNTISLPPRGPRQADVAVEGIKPTDGSNALETDYENLTAKYSALKKSLQDITTRARKFRDERDGWLKYAESLESKIKKLEANIAAQDARRVPKEPLEHIAVLESSGGKSPAPCASVCSEPGASVSFSGPTTTDLEAPPSSRRAISTPLDLPSQSTNSDHQPSSPTRRESPYVTQATLVLPRPPQNGPSGIVLIKEEPSDDVVVVSERSLRKRKRGDSPPSSTPYTHKIKSEHASSDPVVTGEAHNFSPQESIDLDVRQDVIITPKKRRALDDDISTEFSGPEADDHDGSTLFEACLPQSSKILVPQSQSKTPAQPKATPTTAVRLSSSSALIPATIHTAIPVTVGWPRRPARRDGWQIDDGIADLAESGETASGGSTLRASIERLDQTPAAEGRLSSLLNKPSLGVDGVLLRPNRQTRKAVGDEPFDIHIPTRKLPFGRGGEGTANRTPKAVGNQNRNQTNPKSTSRLQASETTSTKSSYSSLRRRPLARLRLDDFKINPKFNDGETFAYSEVVRDKSNRQELPGCTDPQCCGKHFRAMAQAELDAAGPSLNHRAADIELLEDYLGEQAHKLGFMNRLEKQELWLEAKTRDLANKHGKHRHRFPRRQSPPGFWNVDFPDTQEMRKEKEEGEKREKRHIEERWREAMRSNGKWLFRDE